MRMEVVFMPSCLLAVVIRNSNDMKMLFCFCDDKYFGPLSNQVSKTVCRMFTGLIGVKPHTVFSVSK